MNKWECDYRDGAGKRCQSVAVGCGGAIGLEAIGWHFKRGKLIEGDGTLLGAIDAVYESLQSRNASVLLCPLHRPDPVPVSERRPEMHDDTSEQPCSLCRAEIEADRIQAMIIGVADLT